MIDLSSNNVMLDIETFGLKASTVIVSVGMVRFNATEIIDSFHAFLNIEDQLRLGRTVSGSTIKWWMQQDEKARSKLTRGLPLPFKEGMAEVGKFFHDNSSIVWGNGADFDNAIVTDAFGSAGLPTPWMYRNNRCFRTVKNLFPVAQTQFEGSEHDALDDAIYQAQYLQQIVAQLNKGK